MDAKLWEPSAILGKSLALIDKTQAILTQLDHWNFPTDTSEDARGLLIETLRALASPTNYKPMDWSVLYNRLFSLQNLTEQVVRSSTHHISWPLVSYCDKIWTSLFGESGPRIFYSLTSEHNYSISRFSRLLDLYLNGLLPRSVVDSLTSGREIYCLQLASSEDYNLPLYANIGHEFGHAIFDLREAALVKLLADAVRTIVDHVYVDLDKKDAGQAVRRTKRIYWAILKLATELFCDLVGAMLMGPAFFISLYEISWGSDKAKWIISLSPSEPSIRAYPSFQFRLHCIRKWARIDEFCAEANAEAKRLGISRLVEIANYIQGIPVGHDTDRLIVRPDSDGDAVVIYDIMSRYVTRLKQALDAFATKAQVALNSWYSLASPCVTAYMVAELLQRLEHQILPNIIPDSTLLGKPATFTAILNACALYRLHLLANSHGGDLHDLSRETSIIERLTAKAFEVSFIQAHYNEWSESNT